MLAHAQFGVPKPPPLGSPRDWTAYFNAMAFLIPDGGSYITPNLRVTKGPLYLEARYNWEDFETGSLFAGWTFSFEKAVKVDITPMGGVVIGRTAGVAPGVVLSVSYKRLAAESESEYVLATNETQNFYNIWTEATYEFTTWLRAGVAIQRNKAFHSRIENQYGLLVNVSYGRLDFTGYGFDLGKASPSAAVAVGVRF